MPLNQRAIEELKAIHRRHWNEELTDQEAWTMATDLLRLVSIVSRPDSKPNKDGC